MMLEMLKTNQIAANSRNVFSMIYQSDAVEFAYRVMMAEHPKYPLYHISSGEVISQMKLAELIQQNAGDGTTIRDDTVGEGYRLVLDGRRYRKEFDGKIFVPYEEGVKAVVEYMKKYSSSFLQREDTGAGWGNRVWRLLVRIFRMLAPYLENLICFIPFFMIHNRAVGSQYFAKLDAYLLYVLLFAIVYGQQQAIFSALLATAGYCFRQMYNQSGLEVLMDNPSSVGTDLIVGAVAGINRYPVPLILIDMGTATTICVVNENKQYIGGMILPGIGVSMNSLTSRTAQLPRISLDPPKRLIGKNTVECMQSGALYGNASCIDGMVDRIQEELGQEATIVATGGLAKRIIPLCRHRIELDDELLLRGLWIIYEKNN